MKIAYPEKVKPVSFSYLTRAQSIQKIKKDRFDLCIIGGGITGAGIAMNASLRGLRVVLIEKSDFAAGTSSKSSKLVHGGFRYLAQFEFGLVREALVERYYLINLAPHLVSRLPTIFPIYEDSEAGFWKVKAGMLLYDLLSGSRNIGKHKMLSAKRLSGLMPELRKDGLRGGAQYFDARADDSRLVMAAIQSATLAGCEAISYFAAVRFEMKDGSVSAVHARDELDGSEHVIQAGTFVNAAGPWSDDVRSLADGPSQKRLRATKGIHLVLSRKRIPINYAAMILSSLDGRPLFAIPWDDFVVLGTTDTDFSGSLEEICATPDDAAYLLDSFGHYFPELHLGDQDIISSFAGLRPLTAQQGKSTSEVSREHEIFESPGNVFNIIGGKLTTFRPMARDLMKLVAHEKGLSLSGEELIDRTPLYGSEDKRPDHNMTGFERRMEEELSLPPAIVHYLFGTYGCHCEELMEILRSDPQGLERIIPDLPFIWGQLLYAIEHEMTVSLDDFLIRRTHIFSLDRQRGRGVVREVAGRMGKILNWSEAEKENQIDKYSVKIQLSERFRSAD